MAISLSAALGSGADKKKMMIFGGLFAVLVVVILIKFFSPGFGLSESAGAATAHTGLLDSRPEYLEAIARIARLRSEKTYDSDDLRSPLDPLVKERSEIPREPRREQEPQVSNDFPKMTLHGIIWDPSNPIAIIDGLDLMVGDTIKGARVVEIRFDSVVLSYRSRRHVLTVE